MGEGDERGGSHCLDENHEPALIPRKRKGKGNRHGIEKLSSGKGRIKKPPAGQLRGKGVTITPPGQELKRNNNNEDGIEGQKSAILRNAEVKGTYLKDKGS